MSYTLGEGFTPSFGRYYNSFCKVSPQRFQELRSEQGVEILAVWHREGCAEVLVELRIDKHMERKHEDSKP